MIKLQKLAVTRVSEALIKLSLLSLLMHLVGPHDGFEPTGYDEERPPAPVDQPDQPMSIPWRLMRILQNNRHWPDGEGLDLSEDCVENTTS